MLSSPSESKYREKETLQTQSLNRSIGFEGLSASSDGKTLYLLLQAATNQEGVSLLPWSRLLNFRS